MELAHYLFVFRMWGKNDIDYMNSLSKGLGDAMTSLPPHHFAMVYPNRSYQLMKPIEIGMG